MIFPFFEYLFGIKRGGFTFPAEALRQIGCAGAKAWFCLRENYFYCIPNFTFYILHSTFTIHNEILRRFAPQDDRRGSNTSARLCHPELVVARLCCQHFADGKMLDLQGGSSSFPKISLRCDFREPCFSAQSNGSL